MELVATDFKTLYEQEKKAKEALQVELMKMQLQLSKFSQMIFGSKSERFILNPAQLTLDIQPETAAPACHLPAAKKIEYVKTAQPGKRNLSEPGTCPQKV